MTYATHTAVEAPIARIGPAVAAASADAEAAEAAGSLPQPHTEEFTPSGLVIPQARIAI